MKNKHTYTKKNKHSNKRATQKNRKNMSGGAATQKINGWEATQEIQKLFDGDSMISIVENLGHGIAGRKENRKCHEHKKEYSTTFEIYLLLDYYGFYDHPNKGSIQNRCNLAITEIQALAKKLLKHDNPYKLYNELWMDIETEHKEKGILSERFHAATQNIKECWTQLPNDFISVIMLIESFKRYLAANPKNISYSGYSLYDETHGDYRLWMGDAGNNIILMPNEKTFKYYENIWKNYIRDRIETYISSSSDDILLVDIDIDKSEYTETNKTRLITYKVLKEYKVFYENDDLPISQEFIGRLLTNDSKNSSFLYDTFQKTIQMKRNIIKNNFSINKIPEDKLKKSIDSYVTFNRNNYKSYPILESHSPISSVNLRVIIGKYKYKHHHLIFSFAEWLHSISPCFIVPLQVNGRFAIQLEPYWCGYSREDPSTDGIHDRKMTIDRLGDDGKPIEKKIITKHIPSIFI